VTGPVEEPPDFGPSGYLAPRAAKRARKIVLRERMGLGWPLAAVLAGVVIAVVAAVFFLRTGPPGPPFVAVISIIDIAPGTAELGGEDVLVVRAAGRVRAFRAPGVPVWWCGRNRRLESAGSVWTIDGALTGGEGESLRPLETAVHDGRVYVDLEDPRPAPAPLRGSEEVACAQG
jgi:hypothetical protein